jgi:hypothetical protein
MGSGVERNMLLKVTELFEPHATLHATMAWLCIQIRGN